MKKIICLLIISTFILSGCVKEKAYEINFFAFDTLVELKIYQGGSQKILAELKEEALRLEKLLNIHDEKSGISQLEDKALIQGELSEVLQLSDEMKENTVGAFDPYLRRVSALWAFGTPQESIPARADIEQLIVLKDEESVEDLDFGGIAKGYAANRLLALAKDRGVKSALFNLGGNIITLGDYQKGSFTIGLQDPLNDTGEILGVIQMKENSAVTSGAYQRGFTVDGLRYHHILDPSTGYPVQGDLLSVTLVLADSARADAYSTALFVMGFDKAKDYATQHALPVVLVREDRAVLVLNAKDFKFELRNDNYHLIEER
ncbi:MAG: FAD:protein FMN transferase [Tissierellia bacterium]|nr:FAD:protein FMN transferase [Tissierellia bacterium]